MKGILRHLDPRQDYKDLMFYRANRKHLGKIEPDNEDGQARLKEFNGEINRALFLVSLKVLLILAAIGGFGAAIYDNATMPDQSIGISGPANPTGSKPPNPTGVSDAADPGANHFTISKSVQERLWLIASLRNSFSPDFMRIIMSPAIPKDRPVLTTALIACALELGRMSQEGAQTNYSRLVDILEFAFWNAQPIGTAEKGKLAFGSLKKIDPQLKGSDEALQIDLSMFHFRNNTIYIAAPIQNDVDKDFTTFDLFVALSDAYNFNQNGSISFVGDDIRSIGNAPQKWLLKMERIFRALPPHELNPGDYQYTFDLVAKQFMEENYEHFTQLSEDKLWGTVIRLSYRFSRWVLLADRPATRDFRNAILSASGKEGY